MECALRCFARLVRVLLGPDAIAEVKLECGESLCVLGVDIEMSCAGYKLRPSAKKTPEWISTLKSSLVRLWPGDASKLAGKLAWGGSHHFRRIVLVLFCYQVCL